MYLFNLKWLQQTLKIHWLMSYLQSMQVSDSFEEINERLAIVF
ncbi:MAG: hypothetical protein ACI93P_002416 [bacterium]|jgi:hypothetical protein